MKGKMNMEKFEKYVVLPKLEFKEGVKLNKDTNLKFKNKIESEGISQEIEQEIIGTTMITKTRTMKMNQDVTSEINIDFMENDILLFDENLGYYPPNEKMGTINEVKECIEAINNRIKSLEDKEQINNEVEGK